MNGQPSLPAPGEVTATTPQPLSRPPFDIAGRRPGSIALAITHRRLSVRFGTERRDVVADTTVLHVRIRTVRLLVLATLRLLAARTAELMTDPAEAATFCPEPQRIPLPKSSRPRNLTGQNCTIVITDVVGFGADSRTEFDRLAIRRATARMLGAAVVLPFKDMCVWEDRGDGLLIVVYPEVPTTAVLDRLLMVLPDELRQHNEGCPPGTRIQLRAAITVGPVVADGVGLSGKAIIRAARMLDTAAFKKAVASSGSVLGLITSAFVHDLAVEADCAPGCYEQVRVNVKESRFLAWIRLFAPGLVRAALPCRLTGPPYRAG
jgi:class 3 adenylate cyclase